MPGFRLYAVLFVLVWALGELAVLGYRPVATRWLAASPHEADYLESLRESSKFGCFTLLQRRPSVAVVGDSHAYSALDFVTLASHLNARVGACAMGGLEYDVIPDVLALARDAGAHAVVLGLSPRMFWRVPASAAQRAEHERLLEQARHNTFNFWRRIGLAAARGRMPFPRSDAAERARAAAEAPRLLALEDDVLARKAPQLAASSYEQWSQRIARATLVPPAEAASVLCDAARDTGLRVVAAPLPESPALVALYPATVRAHFLEVQRALAACGVPVVDALARGVEVHNRDYANRSLSPAYPYARWAEPVDASARASLMDLDHMNGVGARRFTEQLAPLLRDALAPVSTTERTR